MKSSTFLFTLLVALVAVPSATNAAIIAYWNQNSNELPSGAFGYVPGDFPQAADYGSGSLDLANFDTTTGGVDGAYTTIQSFAGTTDNAQFGDAAGGSISPQSGASDGSGGFSNNGMEVLLNVDTSGYTNINISWAQRGTGSGFASRAFAYSADGGANYTSVAYTGDSGALTSTWNIVSPDLSTAVGLDNNANVVFRLTLSGGTGTTGNNRFDNILVQGVPEPATLTLVGLCGLAIAGTVVRRRNS